METIGEVSMILQICVYELPKILLINHLETKILIFFLVKLVNDFLIM